MFGAVLWIAFKSLLLFGLWVVLSGKLTAIHLSIGIVCCILISSVGFQLQTVSSVVRRILAFPACLYRITSYFFWLFTRIILAALHVAKIVLSPKMEIDPQLMRHKTKLQDELGKVVFANSITLTPGTITGDIEGDIFVIHRLDKASCADIDTSLMENQIAKMLGNTP